MRQANMANQQTAIGYGVLTLTAVLQSGCGAGLNQTSITCPEGRTLLDGVCVSEAVADYVACVRAQGAQLEAAKNEEISAEAGYLGVRAGGAAELSERLEKKYTASDEAMMAIIAMCNKTAGVPPSPAAAPPSRPATAAATDRVAAGTYAVLAKHSGKCLDVKGGGGQDGAPLEQFSCHGGDNQKFRLEPAGGSHFKVVVKGSGKCLDVPNSSGADGTQLQQYTCHGVDNQLFAFEQAGGGLVKIVAKHSGKCLDVRGAGSGDQVAVQQWACVGVENQLWELRDR